MKSERGAVVIEAALSLTVFMFAILTFFSMYHVALAQARINSALNDAAKDISQYSYVYDLTGLNAKQEEVANRGGAAQSIISDNLGEVQGLWGALQGLARTAGTIGSSDENMNSFINFVGNEGIEALKGEAFGTMAKSMMSKHFGKDPNGYLKKLGVVNGMQGLNLSRSRLFANGTGSDIFLDVQYQIRVIKLLDIEMKLNFEHCAKTKVWKP